MTSFLKQSYFLRLFLLCCKSSPYGSLNFLQINVSFVCLAERDQSLEFSFSELCDFLSATRIIFFEANKVIELCIVQCLLSSLIKH